MLIPSALYAMLLSCACLPAARAADPVADRVLSLPGWSDPFPSARYSGFLSGSSPLRRLSYFFVTSESSTPEQDPVLVWNNGGPGCSSFIGLFLEQGPILMGSDGSLFENPGRWNMRANVLFLETPPGVGFSHIQGQAPPYTANDTSTSADSLGALVDFFSAYPAFAASPLWLSGESYAGVVRWV